MHQTSRQLLLLAVALCTAVAGAFELSSSCPGNLLVNGGFETPNTEATPAEVRERYTNSKWGWYKSIPGELNTLKGRDVCAAVAAGCLHVQADNQSYSFRHAARAHTRACTGWYTTRPDGQPCARVDWCGTCEHYGVRCVWYVCQAGWHQHSRGRRVPCSPAAACRMQRSCTPRTLPCTTPLVRTPTGMLIMQGD
jgi:hypothetical protein